MDVRKLFQRNASALRDAITRSDSEKVRKLLKKRVINAKTGENKETFLMLAARSYQTPEIINLILSHGPDVNMVDKSGMTALMHACRRGFPTVYSLVACSRGKVKLEVRTDDDDCQTALMLAVRQNDARSLHLLLDVGAKFEGEEFDLIINRRLYHPRYQDLDLVHDLVDEVRQMTLEEYAKDMCFSKVENTLLAFKRKKTGVFV